MERDDTRLQPQRTSICHSTYRRQKPANPNRNTPPAGNYTERQVQLKENTSDNSSESNINYNNPIFNTSNNNVNNTPSNNNDNDDHHSKRVTQKPTQYPILNIFPNKANITHC